MEVVWYGRMADIACFTTMYDKVGAACVGAMARNQMLDMFYVANGPLCKQGTHALD